MWWQTDAGHTQVNSGPLTEQPDGNYVKRANAGDNDELLSTATDSWNRAETVAKEKRPENVVLFPKTSAKMVTGDGDRTYYYNGRKNKATVSVIITHNKDAQSYVYTETDEKLSVVHNHSATANFSPTEKALNQTKHPKYGDTPEAAVHYLSLTPQA